MADLAALTAAVEAGNRADAVSLTQAAIDEGLDPNTVLDAMTAAMTEVGRKFACNEGVYVPEMLIAAHAMKEATAIIEPLLAESGVKPDHTAVIGTVQGDLHDIGKNLVAMMMEGAGWEVIDLGVDVAPEKFVETLKEKPGSVIGLSALLTTTMVNMEKTVEMVKGEQPATLVCVGGAPLTQEFCDKIGADAYAPDPQGIIEWLDAKVGAN